MLHFRILLLSHSHLQRMCLHDRLNLRAKTQNSIKVKFEAQLLLLTGLDRCTY